MFDLETIIARNNAAALKYGPNAATLARALRRALTVIHKHAPANDAESQAAVFEGLAALGEHPRKVPDDTQ
jgi:hypothetical protein